MNRRGRVRNLAVAVVLMFVLMLSYALYKLLGLQSEISTDVGENMVWAVSQSVYQSTQLHQAARIQPPTDDSRADHDLHLDLLRSSLNMLARGPQLRFMQRSGVDADLQLIIAGLDNKPLDYAALTHSLRQLGNAVMLAEREDAGVRRDANRQLLFQVILAVLGILVAGTLLCWQMLTSLRLANQAKDEVLVQHRETQRLLEVLQQERLVRMRYRDFVSLMSHQLRTPLAVIDSTAQRLRRQLTESPGEVSLQERSQRIRTSVHHLNHLIGRVLEGLRLDEGVNASGIQQGIELERCNWVELLGAVQERFGDLLSGRDIRLRLPPGTEAVWVDCDRTWCIEILSNLLSNAHKYSPTGEPIEIELSCDAGQFQCVVRDHGTGVLEAEQTLIFERFYRAENNQDVAGIGLGLPIARTLAQWHGGTLEVSNAASGGARFILTLPLRGDVGQPDAATSPDAVLS